MFPPGAAVRQTGWRHTIRGLDDEFRLRLPEVAQLLGPVDGVRGAVTAGCWELSGARRGVQARIDGRCRVLVPSGVRHRLGLDRHVVVSVAIDSRRIVVWPMGALDRLLEGL